ncbi:GNAT family N-acetyltransferase [Chelativorans sp. M5D2P16]|uniref:GNAT family N-acetyltransferase n=1 Tax=Chelativorans sp. M5D2P16 TaxID=3095678 RepID=UPI002ACA8DB7|nr:GNAT family N-acetyltransferase [Chelativorans sp. M5D2P16]MDZ5696471.1 GNAT family N-acetyltransferase [Chelativorans sp. M5D2P16]
MNGPRMQVEYLSNARGIEPEWWDLWQRDPAATPFQSPAWLVPWRRHFRDGESVILSMREEGRLLALLPLFAREGRFLPWGAGPTDRLDGVFDPRLEPDSLSDALGRLSLPVKLFQLRSDSPLAHAHAPEGWRAETSPAESCAVLSLPARPSKKMAQNLRYCRRRAERAGISGPERSGAAEIEALADLHTRRWRLRGEAGIFADARMLGWLREAFPALEAANLLRLHTMRAGGETVAALCVLTARERSYYYIGGFAPEYARLGLGTVLVGHAIEEAGREGHESFDFLRGREAYKYRWGAADQPTRARRLAPPLRRSA